MLPTDFYDGQLGVLILKSCFATDGEWIKKISATAKRAGAYWLGSGFEAAGIDYGIKGAAKAAQ